MPVFVSTASGRFAEDDCASASMRMSTVACNAMIGACSQAGEWQRALDVLRRGEFSGLDHARLNIGPRDFEILEV